MLTALLQRCSRELRFGRIESETPLKRLSRFVSVSGDKLQLFIDGVMTLQCARFPHDTALVASSVVLIDAYAFAPRTRPRKPYNPRTGASGPGVVQASALKVEHTVEQLSTALAKTKMN